MSLLFCLFPSRDQPSSWVPTGMLVLALSHGTMNCGSLNRGSRIVDMYQPSYEQNENTLQWIVKKEKEVETDEDTPVNPTYTDSDLEGDNGCKSFPYNIMTMDQGWGGRWGIIMIGA